MLRAQRAQHLSGTRVADQKRLLEFQRLEHFEHVVCGSLHAVSGLWFVRCTNSSPCDGVNVELVDELRSELIVHVCGQVTTEQHDRPSSATPIEHFQMN